jgi:hypothetical protein
MYMYDPSPSALRFRKKAEECQALAEHMTEPVARESLLRIALGYEHLAAMLDRAAVPPPQAEPGLGSRAA